MACCWTSAQVTRLNDAEPSGRRQGAQCSAPWGECPSNTVTAAVEGAADCVDPATTTNGVAGEVADTRPAFHGNARAAAAGRSHAAQRMVAFNRSVTFKWAGFLSVKSSRDQPHDYSETKERGPDDKRAQPRAVGGSGSKPGQADQHDRGGYGKQQIRHKRTPGSEGRRPNDRLGGNRSVAANCRATDRQATGEAS